MAQETSIGTIGNYYGGLSVKKEGDKYFWGIENYSGTDWEEIPKKMYDRLMSFEKQRRKKELKQKNDA